MRHLDNLCFFVSLVLCAGLAFAAEAGGAERQHNISASDTSYWETQTTGLTGDVLRGVSVVDANVCWVVSDQRKIIHTEDGGNTWSTASNVPTGPVSTFEGVSDSIAFAGISLLDRGNWIYRSTNAGSSWDPVFSSAEGSFFGIKMFSRTRGIAMGDPVGTRWTVLKTTNSGETWFHTPVEPPVGGGGLSGSWFGTFDTSYVWFFDNTGGYYFSNDGGETWTYSSSTVSGTSLYWWNARTIALFVTPTTVYRYSTGWMVAGSTPGFFFSPLTGLVGALGTHQFWLVRDAIYYTPDAASSWTNSSPNGLNRHVGLIDMVTLGSEISAWATGVGDTVYRFHRTLTGVNEHPQPMPGEFSLSQNYPNPFNPRTTIRFSLSSRSQTLIKVFDLPGRELATLVDGSTEAGAHSVEWDASSLASGVYLYRIQAGDWIETRKMLLLK